MWTNVITYCYLIINRLPDEVWVLIFDYTELKDLRKVARVNTLFAKHARSGHPDSHPPHTVIEVDDSDSDFLIEDYDSDDDWDDLFGPRSSVKIDVMDLFGGA